MDGASTGRAGHCRAAGELDADPVAGLSPPSVPAQRVAVLTPEQLKALLKACQGTGFAERRDTAVLRLFVDTGMRSLGFGLTHRRMRQR